MDKKYIAIVTFSAMVFTAGALLPFTNFSSPPQGLMSDEIAYSRAKAAITAKEIEDRAYAKIAAEEEAERKDKEIWKHYHWSELPLD